MAIRPTTALTLLLAGCGAPGSSPPVADLAATLDLAAPSAADAGPRDLAATDGASAPADLAPRPGDPHPPPGAAKCGSGLLTDGDRRIACLSPAAILDAWGQARQPFPRRCDAATIDSGWWQVWCTPTEAYVHVHFAGLRATGTLLCKNTTMLSLSAVYQAGNSGGDTGNNPRSGYAGSPSYDFDKAQPIDADLWITTAVAARGATLWLAPFSSLIPGCGSMSSGYRTIVGGATVTWKP